MRGLCFFLLVSWLALPVFSQTKHPFTFEDMMSLKRIAEPVVSPNGKWVAFSAVDVDLAANTRTPHIWIVPTAGGGSNAKEREIISTQDADRPRWAPDGKRFAFVSTQEGGSQIWIADFDAAAGTVTGVHRLTSIATEADGELWSPDGKNILFVSSVYPECADEACNAKKWGEGEKSKVKAIIFTRLLYRHWDHYTEGRRSHLLLIPAEGGASWDLTPGDYDAPVFSLGGQDNYAFSPDGQEICYTSNHDPVEATSTNNDLWIVPVNGGRASSPVEAKNITADNPASDSTPLYSPDGKYIAYRAQARPGNEADRFRLMLYDRKTGEKRNLTEDFDRWVGTFTWAPDSRVIYFSSEEAGRSPIHRLDISEPQGLPYLGAFSELGGYADDLAVTQDGTTLLSTHMSLSRPTELLATRTGLTRAEDATAAMRHSVETDCSYPRNAKEPEELCGDTRRITHLNDSVLSQVAMSPLESFWFTGAHNDKVEGFLVKPPNFDPNKKYRVKFILHGGPQVPIGDDWSYRWNTELFAANGYVVIMINFHGSPGYGQKFIDAINGDWGGAPFEDLMKGLDYAEAHYGFIDKDRECALGASYGGYMANWVLGHIDRFKCIVSHDGMFNAESAWGTTEELWFNDWEFNGTPYANREMYRKWSPHLAATNFKTPTLVVHGQLDYRLDVSEGFQLFTTLQMLGVPSKMLYFPDEGHWVLKPQNSQLWYKTVNDWIDQWTKK